MKITCPQCGFAWRTGVTLEDVTVIGPGMNIVAPCPRCGHEWDLTGGGYGTWSTTPDGRLRRVETFLRQQPTEVLEALKARITELERDRDGRQALQFVEQLGVEPPSGGWFGSQANRNELWQILALISTLILGILALR